MPQQRPAGRDKVLEVLLYKQVYGTDEAQRFFNISAETIARYERLGKKEYDITLPETNSILKEIQSQYSESELKAIAMGGRIIPGMDKVPVVDFSGERLRFGLFGDTHIGSIYTDSVYVEKAIKEFIKEGCDFVGHVGDVTEGMSHRDGHIYELSALGYEKQREMAIGLLGLWPKKMYLISGNHDRWYLKRGNIGANIVADIAGGLPDGAFIGHDEGNITLKNSGGISTLRLWHGEDGNSYAVSYRIQKIVESLTGGDKPGILACGHTHKQSYNFLRHIQCISAGCIQKQSSYMRGKRIEANTGFWIVDVWLNKSGICKFSPTWYPFYA